MNNYCWKIINLWFREWLRVLRRHTADHRSSFPSFRSSPTLTGGVPPPKAPILDIGGDAVHAYLLDPVAMMSTPPWLTRTLLYPVRFIGHCRTGWKPGKMVLVRFLPAHHLHLRGLLVLLLLQLRCLQLEDYKTLLIYWSEKIWTTAKPNLVGTCVEFNPNKQ